MLGALLTSCLGRSGQQRRQIDSGRAVHDTTPHGGDEGCRSGLALGNSGTAEKVKNQAMVGCATLAGSDTRTLFVSNTCPGAAAGVASASAQGVCAELMARSPYLNTGVSLQGTKVFQSPLSCMYYGCLQDRQPQPGKPLYMSLLQDLFQLEGEELMQEMLACVQQSDAGTPTVTPGGTWRRVMRVPISCDHTTTSKVSGVQPTASQFPLQPTLHMAGRSHSQTAFNAHSSVPSVLSYDTAMHSSNPFAASRPNMSEDTAKHSNWQGASSTMWPGASASGNQAMVSTDHASAVSVAIRNAPDKIRSLVELSMASRSRRTGYALGSTDNEQAVTWARGSVHLKRPDGRSLDLSRGGSPCHRVVGQADWWASQSLTQEGLPLCREPQASSPQVARELRQCRTASGTGSGMCIASSPVNIQHPSRPQPVAFGPRLPDVIASADSAQPDDCLGRRQGSDADVFGSFDEPPMSPCSGTPTQAMAASSTHEAHDGAGFAASGSMLREEVQEQGTEAVQGYRLAGISEVADEVLGSDSGSGCCWHEVFVTRATDSSDGSPLLLIYQVDVTVRTHLEATMAQLSEAHLDTLCQIFPKHVIEFLSLGAANPAVHSLGHLARSHQDVVILFADIVGFTSMSKQVAPDAVMNLLNQLFLDFDELCMAHGVHKVETAGDCYMVSSGLLTADGEGYMQVAAEHDPKASMAKMFAFAKDMLAFSRQVVMPHDGSPVSIRIGIHTGPCMSGVVGSKLPKFGLFGDTVNTASRMESTCTPGRIQISAPSHQFLLASGDSEAAEWDPTGGIQVKGKGVMETFMWREPTPATGPCVSPFLVPACDLVPEDPSHDRRTSLSLKLQDHHSNTMSPCQVPARSRSLLHILYSPATPMPSSGQLELVCWDNMLFQRQGTSLSAAEDSSSQEKEGPGDTHRAADVGDGRSSLRPEASSRASYQNGLSYQSTGLPTPTIPVAAPRHGDARAAAGSMLQRLKKARSSGVEGPAGGGPYAGGRGQSSGALEPLRPDLKPAAAGGGSAAAVGGGPKTTGFQAVSRLMAMIARQNSGVGESASSGSASVQLSRLGTGKLAYHDQNQPTRASLAGADRDRRSTDAGPGNGDDAGNGALVAGSGKDRVLVGAENFGTRLMELMLQCPEQPRLQRKSMHSLR